MSAAANLDWHVFQSTHAAGRENLASNAESERLRRDSWQNVYQSLAAWSRDPSAIADDDPPPSRATLSLAGDVAARLENAKVEPPTSVVPSGAGVVFEWHRHEVFESITVSPEGGIEIDTYKGSKLINSVRVSP